MDEQLLKDFLATAQADKYNWDVIMPKFPELADIDLQVLKDYAETAIQRNYEYETINPLFPEIFSVEDVKKKEDTELQLVDGSLAQPTIQAPKIDTQPEVETQTVVETTEIIPEEDPDLPVTVEDISKDEEFIVPALNYKFQNDGFVFEESGITDNVKVTAANDETITIGLDAFTTAKNREERDKLNKFILDNKEESVSLQKAQKKYDYSKIIFETDKEVNDRIDALNEDANAFSKNLDNYLGEKSRLVEEGRALMALSTEQKRAQKDRIDKYNEEVIRLNKSLQQIQKYNKNLESRERALDAAVGEYYEMKRSQGSMTAGIVDQILRGVGEIPAGIVDLVIDAAGVADTRTKMTPERKIAIDKRKKEVKERILPPIREFFVETFGGKDVSEQWMMAQQQKFFPGAFLGLARNLPAFLAPGGKLVRIPALFAQVNSQYEEEFKDLDLTEDEKVLLKVPLSLVIAQLENFGFRNVLGNSSLVKRLLFNASKKVPTNANASVLNDFIRNEIKSKLGRAGSRFTTAALAEAETGAFQEGADIGGKELFESLKGKDLFQTPEGVTEILSEIAYAAGQEAVGGFVLGTLPAISDAYAQKDFTRVDKEVFNMFNNIMNDGFTKKAFVQQQKQKIEKGELTKEDAQIELDNFDKAAGLASQIPTDISVEKQQQILGLLTAKQELQNQKENKDPATVGNIDQQIQQIDNQIEQVLKQEQTVEEPIREMESADVDIQVDDPNQSFAFQYKSKEEVPESLKGITPIGEGTVQIGGEKFIRLTFSGKQLLDAGIATEVTKADPEVQTEEQLTEEQQDLDAFFGEQVEETTETVESNLSVNRAGETVKKGAEQIQRENNVTKIAKKAASAIKNLLPNTRIVLHENESEYLKFAAPGRGELIGDTIHINLSKATGTTVPHEVFHAVLLSKIKTDPEAAVVAEKMMTSVLKTLSQDSKLARRIDAFAELYKDASELQNEERLAELIGIMSSEYQTLTKPQKNIVIRAIEALARQLGVKLKISEFTKTDEDVIDLLNTLSGKVKTGEEITEADIEILESGELLEQEQGEGGQVGTVEITEPKRRAQKAPNVSNDTRSFASLIQEKNLNDFNGQTFVTNMYDFTNSGPTEIAPGIVLQLDGGKSYVPLMMERQGLKLGDKSNLAAFNSQAQAETFIRNSQQGNANLFMPHVGTKEGSWQFQQNLLEQLSDAALQNNILSNREIINTFNEGLSSKEGKKAFDTFKKKLGRNIRNFNIFRDNPKQLIELLDINNNYSPDLRKILNDKLSANKKYQEAVGVKNKLDFVGKFEDPLNVGSVAGDLVSIIEFDNKTFEVSKPNIGAVDYHPSFAFTIKANINGIYQPTEFLQSSDVTKKYLKYNLKDVTVSEKKVGRETQFDRANVKSSAGSIPKVATAELVRQQRRQQRTIEQVAQQYNMDNQGFIPKTANLSQLRKAVAPFGLEARRARIDQFGRGGGLFLVRDGRKFNPFAQTTRRRQQRTPADYIREGREAGFRDELIIDYLKRVRKIKAKEIKELMEIDSEILGALPESFKNITGGAKAGSKLFTKIDNFIKSEKFHNKESVEKKLTDAQIMDKTIAFLEKQPEYINEADTFKVKGEVKQRKTLSTKQALMLSDLQKTLNQRPTKDIAQKIRAARAMVRNRTKGQRDLQKVKRELRNFMRKTLPRAVFTKGEAIKLARKIELATDKNIENLMDEVIQLATVKNNAALQSKIDKVLGGKYETLVSGRKKGVKIDLDTRKRIESIANNVLSNKATPDDISAKNEQLNVEFLKLSMDPSSDPFVSNKMVDLQIAINLNNALLLENTDSNKTVMLDRSLDALTNMVQIGKSVLNAQIEAQAKEYRRQFGELFNDITGIKLDVEDPDLGETLKKIREGNINLQKKKDLDKRVLARAKRIINNIKRALDTGILGRQEAVDGLMARISSLPGEMFGGKAQELVTDKLDASTREFKKRRLMLAAVLEREISRYLGSNWRQLNKKFSQQEETGIYKNPERVKKAKEALDKDPTSIEKSNEYTRAQNEEAINYSQNQLYYMYNQYKDPANKGAFANMYGDQAPRIMQEIENYIDPRLKRFADWQVNVFYPSLYPHYNEVYKRIYRTDMPMNKYYAGFLSREGVTDTNTLDLIGNQGVMTTSVGTASTKARRVNNNPIVFVDGTTALTRYMDDMEYFAAYAESIRDIDKLFRNPDIKAAIEFLHGKEVNSLITDAIAKIASRGGEKQIAERFLDGVNTAFLLSRLGINPVIMIKQLTSTFTYASDIGYGNWLKYAAKNKSQQLKIFKEIRDNSVYMQDRNNNNILRSIESYSEDQANKVLPVGARTKEWIVNFLMAQVVVGDRAAIMLGGAPNYSYYKDQFKKKNPNATEQQAIDHAIIKFERDTKRTQQSSDLQDKDFYQRRGPIFRALNMFLTTPKQYLRKEIIAVRELNRKLLQWDKNAGKGTVGENLRVFVMYHIFMPVLFQYVTLGLPGLLREFRDDDDDDILRAMILGNLNAIFIFGEIFTLVGDAVTGKPWTSTKEIGILAIAKGVIETYKKAQRTKNPKLKAQYMNDFYLEFATVTGVPALTLKKLVDNYTKVLDSKDMGEAILRLFNFSEYAIKGRQKKATRPKMTKKELELLVPGLYDEINLQEEDPEIKELEKEIKEIEKELLEELYK